MMQNIKFKFRAIQEILSEEWDPIPGAPKDEYDDYINRLIKNYSEGGFGTRELTEYLLSLEEVFSYTGNPELTKDIAERIILILKT